MKALVLTVVGFACGFGLGMWLATRAVERERTRNRVTEVLWNLEYATISFAKLKSSKIDQATGDQALRMLSSIMELHDLHKRGVVVGRDEEERMILRNAAKVIAEHQSVFEGLRTNDREMLNQYISFAVEFRDEI